MSSIKIKKIGITKLDTEAIVNAANTGLELYDETVNSAREEDKDIARKCLEVWDKMYEKNIGMARSLTEQMLCI